VVKLTYLCSKAETLYKTRPFRIIIVAFPYKTRADAKNSCSQNSLYLIKPPKHSTKLPPHENSQSQLENALRNKSKQPFEPSWLCRTWVFVRPIVVSFRCKTPSVFTRRSNLDVRVSLGMLYMCGCEQMQSAERGNWIRPVITPGCASDVQFASHHFADTIWRHDADAPAW